MARVLFCWEMGNGLDYMEGLTAGARAIAKAGHEVQFAARDLTHAERLLGGRFPFYQAPTTVLPPGMNLRRPMTFADVLINLGWDNPSAVTARVRAWRNLIELVKPDIVRCAHAPGALLAVRGTPIRSLVVGIGFLVPPGKSPLPLLRSWATDAQPERMAAREQLVLDGMNQGLAAIGAPPVASVGALYAEADIRELYTYPELDDYGPRQDVKYLGNFQGASGAKPEWPTLPGKKVFAYLEPLKQVDVIIQALAACGQPVLAYLPHASPEIVQRYAGSNLRITDKPVDVVETTATCDVGVSMGGHNIIGSFMGAGKPQLMVPAYFNERITATKAEAAGVGLISGVDAKQLQERLGMLVREPAYAEKARALGAKLAPLTLESALKGAVDSVNELAAMGPRR